MSDASAIERALLCRSPPRAHGATLGSGVLRQRPEDFIVEEELGFVADGGAGHVLLRVEKRGLDTLEVVRRLARAGGVAPRDVGFAGLKDRHAVTRQWMTVPSRPRAAPEWADFGEERDDGAGYRVLEALPQSRKLKRGALKGNRFRIVVGDVHVDGDALAARSLAIGSRGVPNYFGAQRFGRDYANLARVEAWLAGAEAPREREARAFLYSTARSIVFNRVLAARVVDGSWERLLPGEFVNLDRSRSYFVAPEVDATLEARLASGDIHPTGPLVGRGESPGGHCGDIEAAALRPEARLAEALVGAGLEAARRPLRVVPRGFVASVAGTELTLEFSLPAGAYATTVIAELVTVVGDLPPEPEEG